MKHPPPFLPPEVAALTAPCSRCGKPISPKFWDWSPEPFEPIFPKGTDGSQGGWVQVSTAVKCECGGDGLIPIPTRTATTPIWFFGDEAYKQAPDDLLVTYTCIGGSSGTLASLRAAILKAKAELIPSTSPDAWTAHAMVLAHGDLRRKNPLLAELDRGAIEVFFEACATAVAAMAPNGWNISSSGLLNLAKMPKEILKIAMPEAKTSCHLALLNMMIDRTTSQGCRPVFIFDAETDRKGADYIERWAIDSYQGSTHYLGNAFLSRGNVIAPPQFWKPGSDPCLEAADLHAYFNSRAIWRKLAGKEPDFDVSRFGVFWYLWQTSTGFNWERGTSLPDRALVR